MSAGFRVGVDLGGTKIEAAAIDRDGLAHARRRVATPAGDYAGTITAGTGLVKNANSTWLIGQPLGRDLEAALGRPVRLANDANCFALSEASDGAAAGCSNVFGVILGTGVGGGVVIGGRIVFGVNAIAGEWGHNPLPWPQPDELPGPHCYCGRAGCIETFLSGPGLARDHRAHGGDATSGERIVAGAASGDLACRATLDRYAGRLARALAHVINILDPEAIVLGGGLSAIASLYDEVPRRWGGFVFSDSVHTHLLPPKHGDSSGVRGAAWLWRPEEAAEGAR
ncbi:MAG TPA: ROK family protein [Stellaceae bacterium]|jgi:fructokinase|nr:ROK family protein [Stellaceae bacterium]